jgi:hypothetical protein
MHEDALLSPWPSSVVTAEGPVHGQHASESCRGDFEASRIMIEGVQYIT